MNIEKWMQENFRQEQSKQFGEILEAAVASYISNKDESNINTWLYNYLISNIPDKKAEEISLIVKNIIDTVNTYDETITSLRNSVANGKSVESWFQEETSIVHHTNGQQAYALTETYLSLENVSNQIESSNEPEEIIEIESLPIETWNDAKWNKYRLKELVKETLQQAGQTALQVTASDLNEKMTELGFKNVITNKELINDSLLKGTDAGLKVAVSGAMEVANAHGLIPDKKTDVESRSLIACMAIENVKTIGKIAKGEIGITNGLKEIKETSVSTIATIVKTKTAKAGAKIGKRIGETVGAVFGPVGAAVGHFVGGAVGKMVGSEIGTTVVETAKKVSSAAKTVVSKTVETVKSFGSKIKSGLKSILGW